MTDNSSVPGMIKPDHHALFLDFDGTLAPIQDDPDTVALLAGLDRILADLAGKSDGAVAIISGRDIDDLSSRVPANLWRMGNHGLNIMPPNSDALVRDDTAPAELVAGFEALRTEFPGIMVEEKGSVIALHFRARPDDGDRLLAAAQQIAHDVKGYGIQAGKMVLEAKPAGANKGLALRQIMQREPFAGRVPVMVGDDVTDEDGFAAALDLGGRAVKVGEGDSLATERLASPAAVLDWLNAAI